jgi:hypothetical protein
VESYDPKKIGPLFAWGGEHIVYAYGDGEIIKFSIVEFLTGESWRLKEANDYEVCRRTFGDYVLPTETTRSPNHKYIGKIQRRLQGHPLCKNDLRDADIRRQFDDIIRAYRALAANGHSVIDFIGRYGVIYRSLSNIIVEDGRLFIIDTTLVEAGRPVLLRVVFWLMRKGLLWRQEMLIRDFLKM